MIYHWVDAKHELAAKLKHSRYIDLSLSLECVSVIKIIPIHDIPKSCLAQVSIDKMLRLGCSDPSVDFASRFPTKKASHLTVNKPNDLIIVNYDIRLVEVVVHETHVRVGIAI